MLSVALLYAYNPIIKPPAEAFHTERPIQEG